MERDQIINILVVAVGLFITIVSSMKKKKAAAQQQQTPPSFDSDPYETTEHTAGSDFHEAEDYPRPDAGPWSYDSQIIDETTRRMPVGMKTEREINKFDRRTRTYDLKQNAEATEGAEVENEKNDIISNFNLRDAIIYSELLKPKFKD